MTRHDSEPADDTAGDWSLYAPLSGATYVPSGDEQAGPDEVAAARARLRAWAAFFEDHFHWETGWDGAGRSAPHAAEGRELRRLLVDQLGPGYVVTLDLWEA